VGPREEIVLVTHEQALAIVQSVVARAAAPVSVFVADDHGEVVAALRMDGAAHDTKLNAERKAYTAARSDQTSTRALAGKVRDDPAELASFDPRFSFFLGGVAAFSGGRRVGAVGVSGLPGADDERLAIEAIRAAGLDPPDTD
jgi:glc operon protein GlcG